MEVHEVQNDVSTARESRMIPIEQFGKDHWTTFAYIETRCVDYKGTIDFERMRCDVDRHPQFNNRGEASGSFPTRLKGGVEVPNHDDWDCVEDLIAHGLLEWQGTGVHPVFVLTKLGTAAADALRAFKRDGGRFTNFSFVPLTT